MDQMINPQELAERFNEDEAVWQRYEYKRRRRLLRDNESLLPDEVLDQIDWIEAERECRQPKCVGQRLPKCNPHKASY